MKPRNTLTRTIWAGSILSALTLCGSPAAAAAASPTFEQVFAAPDDANLNLDYAYAQADAGNLLEAAGALERVLLAHPDWHSVRLYYAALLYRLDDIKGAQQELRDLEKAPLSAAEGKTANTYRKLTGDRQKRGKVSGVIAVGATYENDALGALITQFDLPGVRGQQGGGAASTVFGRLDASMKLDPDGLLSGYVSALGYNKSDFSGPEQDFQLGEMQAGLSNESLMSSWRVGGLVRYSRLFNAPYLTEYGGRAQMSRRLNTATKFTASLEATHQNFDDTFLRTIRPAVAGSRDGARYEGAVGLSYRFNARTTIGVLAAYESKTASYRPFAYKGPRFEASYAAALGRGAYLNLLGSLRLVDYRAADAVFLAGVRRSDANKYIRFAAGAPLSAFTAKGATGDVREKMTLEAALTYTRRDSRAPIADYSSVGAELRLVWRLGDGS